MLATRCQVKRTNVKRTTYGSWFVVTVVLAKFLILSRTTLIPRSSDALSSSTRDLYSSGPNNCLHKAKIVEVCSRVSRISLPVQLTDQNGGMSYLSSSWWSVE